MIKLLVGFVLGLIAYHVVYWTYVENQPDPAPDDEEPSFTKKDWRATWKIKDDWLYAQVVDSGTLNP